MIASRKPLRRATAACLIAWALAASASACGSATPGAPRRNLLFVSCDALRADHVGAWGRKGPATPSIDRLARQGVLFRRAFAPRGQTWPSLTSVMTSTYPITHGVRTNGMLLDESHETFSRYLRGRGYVTGAFLSNMAGAAHRGYDELFLPERGGHAQYGTDLQTAAAAIRFLRGCGRRPFFAWVHFMNPHGPYRPPAHCNRFHDGPPGRYPSTRPNLHRIALERIRLSPSDLASMIADYDGDVLAADECVGRVLGALDALGLARSTVVVFFADHGEELYQRHQYFMHSCSIYDSVLHVPLILRLPGALPSSRIVDEVVDLVDVVPTAARLAGVSRPPWARGADLTGIVRGRRGRGFAVGEWAPPMEPTRKTRQIVGKRRGHEAVRALEARDLDRRTLPKGELRDDIGMTVDPTRSAIFTLRTDRFRFVFNPGEETPNDGVYAWEPGRGYPIPREELFDHRIDPGERDNRVAALPAPAARLRERLQGWIRSHARGKGQGVPTRDPATLERLRALGYLPPAPPREEGDGAGGGRE